MERPVCSRTDCRIWAAGTFKALLLVGDLADHELHHKEYSIDAAAVLETLETIAWLQRIGARLAGFVEKLEGYGGGGFLDHGTPRSYYSNASLSCEWMCLYINRVREGKRTAEALEKIRREKVRKPRSRKKKIGG